MNLALPAELSARRSTSHTKDLFGRIEYRTTFSKEQSLLEYISKVGHTHGTYILAISR